MPIPQLRLIKKSIQDAHRTPREKRTRSRHQSRTPYRRRAKRAMRIGLGVGLALGLLAILGAIAAFAIVSRDLPDPNKVVTGRDIALSTKIYDRTGTIVLYEIHGDQRRSIINLEDIPQYARDATIAIEDKDFYKHHGFDLTGILRAILKDISSLSFEQGGSTITQQFIKNSLLTTERSIPRKIKELILAYEIESRFTKDQILKLYLNEIPYGSNAYGIEAAANIYFGISARDLTLSQAALLAAFPQAPTYYWNHKDALLARRNRVLDEMVAQNYITPEQAIGAKKDELQFAQIREPIIAPHFVQYVKEQLTNKYGEKLVEQGGLKVITSLDRDKQQAAEDAVKAGADINEKKYNATQAALVSIDPRSGEILAMAGSRDYFDEVHDGSINYTLSLEQPGSSFKPIVYAAAFARGYTPDTTLFDVVTTFKTLTKPYIPHNYDGKEHGPVTMRQALAGSLNIPAVKTLYLAGIDRVLSLADRMGYTTFSDRDRFGLSVVLGGGEVRLLEHTAAFGVFLNDGVRHPTFSILRVEDRAGKILEEHAPSDGEQIVEKEVARNITGILSDNTARSFIFGSRTPLVLKNGRQSAAKTGTTNDWRDGLTIGGTPSVVAGVWTGNPDNSIMKRGADGVLVAAPIWNVYMEKVLQGTPMERFNAPKPITVDKPILSGKIEGERMVSVDSVTGRPIPASCIDSYPKEFVAQKTVKEVHNILYWVDKDNPRGPEPKDPTKDPQYQNWEDAVQQWAKTNGYGPASLGPEESCTLHDASNAPLVAITAPLPNAVLTPTSALVKVEASSPSQTIKSVEVFLDAISIDQITTPPYETSLLSAYPTNGKHTLSVRATDVVGNSVEVSQEIETAFEQIIPPNANTNAPLPINSSP